MTASLLNRGIAALARREYSPAELKRKLAQYAASDAELDEVLQSLIEQGYLSASRFAASFVRRESARKGALSIKHRLKQHELPSEVIASLTQELQTTEEARARALWARRFGQIANEPKERLRQMRFLASRGFSHEVIRRITRAD
ncbi:MAG: recombination regulator RecX [Betaproteobacteria bacterium]|nr:recombination regulator RecX [Pseudomonadota bacterium]NBO95900.1 recombination regulator RecX [Betaproteobacteria bacterium]HAB47591.1 recombination regulator RecX [Lautropia sp.]NBP38775.1 recombination regulator RecX [Betaproteobacteria bacterium]NBQ78644.1 recombination regulator RecX [Betaproteobacteria bacterium]